MSKDEKGKVVDIAAIRSQKYGHTEAELPSPRPSFRARLRDFLDRVDWRETWVCSSIAGFPSAAALDYWLVFIVLI